MKRKYSGLTEEQIAELKALEDMPDELIDFSDIPPVQFSDKAEIGKFYRPVMVEVTLLLDNYIIQWFKENAEDGADYAAAINHALLGHIMRKRLAGRVPD